MDAEERIELIKQGYERWNRGDRSFVLDNLAEDIEWVTPPSDPEPGHFRGRAEVVGFWDQWKAAVGQLTFDLTDWMVAGDNVIVMARRHGRGEHSGLEVADRVVQVFTFSGEECTRVAEFNDLPSALASLDEASAASIRRVPG